MMRALLPFLLLAPAACSTDFVSPEDERCTIYVSEHAEGYQITRWQIEHCEKVRVVVVRFDGTVLHSFERSSR